MDVEASKWRIKISNIERDFKINKNNLKLVTDDRDSLSKKYEEL
jgi:hypothetical protein